MSFDKYVVSFIYHNIIQNSFTALKNPLCLEKERQPSPVFLPGKCHGQRSLMGRSPWVVLKLGSTQQLRTQVFPKTTLKCVCVCVCVPDPWEVREVL